MMSNQNRSVRVPRVRATHRDQELPFRTTLPLKISLIVARRLAIDSHGGGSVICQAKKGRMS